LWTEADGIIYTNSIISPNFKPIENAIRNGNDNALSRLLTTPNVCRVEIALVDAPCAPYMEIIEQTLHAGWADGAGAVYYARSSSYGEYWWYIDASEHCAPYLEYCGLEPTPAEMMQIIRALETAYIVDGCHYIYVPLAPPDDFPYYLPPGAELWGTVNDPYFSQYPYYEYLTIKGMHFFKPQCVPDGIPNPPPMAPDAAVVSLNFTFEPDTVDEYLTLETVCINNGDAIISNVEIAFAIDGLIFAQQTVQHLYPGVEQTVSVDWDYLTTTVQLVPHNLTVTMDYRKLLQEGIESNNGILSLGMVNIDWNKIAVPNGEIRHRHGETTAEVIYGHLILHHDVTITYDVSVREYSGTNSQYSCYAGHSVNGAGAAQKWTTVPQGSYNFEDAMHMAYSTNTWPMKDRFRTMGRTGAEALGAISTRETTITWT